MQSWIFSVITPVLSVTWSFRNHSFWYADLLLKKHLLLLLILKKIELVNIFVETVMQLFSGFFDEIEILKNPTVTFDQFNMSLLNKTVIKYTNSKYLYIYIHFRSVQRKSRTTELWILRWRPENWTIR